MKKILFIPLTFISLSYYACKDDYIDASFFKNKYFEEYVYPNFPDQSSVDTIKYYFSKDTLTAIGNIYKWENNHRVAIDRDTQSYYFNTHDSKLFLHNIELPDPPQLTKIPAYVGITINNTWRITNYSHNIVDVEFLDSKGKFSGNTRLCKK